MPLPRLCFLLLPALACTAPATDFYLSPAGNDSNSGTSSSAPWQTINRVNNTTFQPGDRILFQGGQSFSGTILLDATDAGSSANPITLTSYGSGRATIQGGASNGLYVEDTGGYVVTDLNFTANWNSTTQTGNDGDGIAFFCSLGGAVKLNYLRISNVTVTGFRNNGISIGAWPADGTMSGYNDVQITGCTASDNGDCGISTWGYLISTATTYAHTNVTVRNCTAFNNRGIIDKGSHSGSGIILGGVNGALMERCLAYNNGELNNYTGGGPIGLWTYDANAVTIQFCESHSNKTGLNTPDGGGFDLDGGVTSSILQYNYSHDNYGAGYLVYQYAGARPSLSNNILRYNISQNDGRRRNYGGIHLSGGTNVKNNQIYSNTIYVSKPSGSSPPAFKAGTVGIGNAVRNNIFFTTGGVKQVDTGGTNITFQGNNYWPGGSAFSVKYGSIIYSDLPAWRTGTGQEMVNGSPTGSAVDPLLTSPGQGGTFNEPYQLNQLSAYRLQAGSPMINTGLNLTTLFGLSVGNSDYYSNAVPQGSGFDIGAHEFGAIIFTQNFNSWTLLSDYISAAPDSGQLHDLKTYNAGSVPECWSISSGRLQAQRTTISNACGFTRLVTGGVSPSFIKVKFKLRVSAGMSANTFGDLATLDVGNILSVTGYNLGTPNTAIANRLIIKGAGAGLYRLRLNTSPAIDSPSYAFNGGTGTALSVEWFVNQSGGTVTYSSPGGSETLGVNACDLFVNGAKVNNDAARNSAFTAGTMGGFRFRVTAVKSVAGDPDILLDLDDLEVVPMN